MRLMRSTALKSSRIRNVEVHRVFHAMLNATDGHVVFMDLRSIAGVELRNVTELFAHIANARKVTAAATVSDTPTASTSNAAASVVDLVGGIAAFIAKHKRMVEVAKTGGTLRTLEKELAFWRA